jgi:hypothetical protein
LPIWLNGPISSDALTVPSSAECIVGFPMLRCQEQRMGRRRYPPEFRRKSWTWSRRLPIAEVAKSLGMRRVGQLLAWSSVCLVWIDDGLFLLKRGRWQLHLVSAP